MKNPFEIVVVSSHLERRLHLADILTKLGLDPICASTLSECNENLAEKNVGLVFCDARVTDGNYHDLLKTCANKKPKIVLTSNSGDREEFHDAMKEGAFYVISTPYRPTDVEWMVIQARRDAQKAEIALAQYA